MDGKFIYILLLIGYFVFKFFSEDKKAKERKQKIDRTKNSSLPSSETAAAPRPSKPWNEILQEIMNEAQQKKNVVMNPPPFASVSKSKPVAKKKKIAAVEMKHAVTASSMIAEAERKQAFEEGGSSKQKEGYDIEAYHLEETNIGRTIDLREAVIQSVILNRPEY